MRAPGGTHRRWGPGTGDQELGTRKTTQRGQAGACAYPGKVDGSVQDDRVRGFEDARLGCFQHTLAELLCVRVPLLLDEDRGQVVVGPERARVA